MKKSIIFTLVFMGLLMGSIFLRNCFCQEFDTYTNEQLGISFGKPKDWSVFIDGGTIFIKPSYDNATGVFLYPVLRTNSKMSALSFIRFAYDQAKLQYPDLNIIDKRVNADDTLAEITAVYTKQGGVVQGFYMVSIDKNRGLFCGYEATGNEFDNGHGILGNILKSLKITPLTFYNATKENTGKPTIDINNLVTKASSDGTMFAAVPSDWTVNGGNFAFFAGPADEKMGITATNDHQPTTYDPYQYLINNLMPFFRCTGTVVTKREPNYEIMKAQPYPANAENFIGEATQANGQKVYFWMMVNATTVTPMGTGFVSTIGFYAVPELFERNAKVLYAITASVNPNQELIMSNLNANLNRLNQASKTISETSDVVIQGLRSSTANWDRAMDKYNYYLSGEEARYSPLENRIYVVDSNLENYASNPHYPQEMLTTVPDNKWNTLVHERNY